MVPDRMRSAAVYEVNLRHHTAEGTIAAFARDLPRFEKEAIDWSQRPHEALYRRLFDLKRRHAALWNGRHGAPAELLAGSDRTLLAFRRGQGDAAVTVVANLSAQPRTAHIDGLDAPLALGPWGWWIAEPPARRGSVG
jgi:glycosidase